MLLGCSVKQTDLQSYYDISHFWMSVYYFGLSVYINSM